MKNSPLAKALVGATLTLSGLVPLAIPGADASPIIDDPGIIVAPFSLESFTLSAPNPLPEPGATGAITVTKQSRQGTAAQTTFTATQVLTIDGIRVDLTTADGWELIESLGLWADSWRDSRNPQLAAIPVAQVQARATFSSTVHRAQTDYNGRAVFSGLPVGLYLVEEVATTSSHAEPILVTLPYPDPISQRWIYSASPTPKVTLPGPEPTPTTPTPTPPRPTPPTTTPIRPTVPPTTTIRTVPVGPSGPTTVIVPGGTTSVTTPPVTGAVQTSPSDQATLFATDDSELFHTGIQVLATVIGAALMLTGLIALRRRAHRRAAA